MLAHEERMTEVLRRLDLGERPAAIGFALNMDPKKVSQILRTHRPQLKSPSKAGKHNITKRRDEMISPGRKSNGQDR